MINNDFDFVDTLIQCPISALNVWVHECKMVRTWRSILVTKTGDWHDLETTHAWRSMFHGGWMARGVTRLVSRVKWFNDFSKPQCTPNTGTFGMIFFYKYWWIFRATNMVIVHISEDVVVEMSLAVKIILPQLFVVQWSN